MTNWLCSTIALVQLIFMILFSYFYLPKSCLYPDIPNLNSSNASMTKNNCLWNLEEAESHSSFPFFILVWTCLLLIIGPLPDIAFFSITGTRHSIYCNRCVNALRLFMVYLRHQIAYWPFSISVFVWLSDQHDPKNISMVFLFGWIGALGFLSSISKKLSIFTTLLADVLSIDILPRFLPFFGLTFVAFSFSLHVLRVELLPQEQHYEFALTAYDVFAASFGMGEEMFKNARQETWSKDVSVSLFAVVFMTYMFFTAVILINVLIAMISNRYKQATQKATNNWRYQALRRWAMFESVGVRLSLPVENIHEIKWLLKTEMYNGIFIRVDLKRNEPKRYNIPFYFVICVASLIAIWH